MKKFLISLLVCMVVNGINGINVNCISNTYKEGIYQVSDIISDEYIAKLTGKSGVATLIIVGVNGEMKFYKSFNTYNEPVNIGIVINTDKVIVVGTGEVAIYNK